MPNPPIPLAIVLPALPKNPPSFGAILLIAPTAPLPSPPNTPPNAVPTPGTNIAIGATTLAIFLSPLPNFFKKPCSSAPV